MDTELKNAVKATDTKAQYDESAKRLLGQKSILAHILLLGALLSKELTIDEKLNIIGNEYDIPIEESFRKDVSVMCNLSQGIEDKGIAIGEAAAEARIILTMHSNGFTAEQIASAINKGIEDVEAIIKGKELELA